MFDPDPIQITEEQFVSLQALLQRWTDLPKDIFLHGPILDHALEVVFSHLHILIETDGYTHS